MSKCSFLIPLLWLLSTTTAYPLDTNARARTFLGSPGTTFTVPLVPNPYYSSANCTLPREELLQTYAAPFKKHNMAMPAKLRSALDELEAQSGPTLDARQTTEVKGNPIPGSAQTPVFTVDFYKVGNDTQNGTGTIDFGFVDTTKYYGNLIYAPVIPNQPLWLIQSSGYSVGDAIFHLYTYNIMVDTGTNVNLLPQPMCNALYSRVAGAYESSDGFWHCPRNAALPYFYFGIGPDQVRITPSSFIFSHEDQGNNQCLGSWVCGTYFGAALLGVPALDALFVAFDYGNMSIVFRG